MTDTRPLHTRSSHNKLFHAWMTELHRIHLEVYKVHPDSAVGQSTKPGAVEEADWYSFYLEGFSPASALAADAMETL